MFFRNLGVPFASSMNISSAVGYLVYMDDSGSCMEVVVLGCDTDCNIFVKEKINLGFEKKRSMFEKRI